MLTEYSSPAGPLLLGASRGRLLLCDWTASRRHATHLRRLGEALSGESAADALLCREATVQLEQYFAGQRTRFDLPLAFHGTPFQLQVWNLLTEVPYGSTITYGDLSRRLGNPLAVRAVANAVGSNPLSILVPCHRIVGADGSLTGYAGGLDAKRMLLRIEGR